MEIGAKIKELRLKNGLTQEELGDRCELTKGYISQLENDLTSPSILSLKDILASLGSSLSEFFADEEEEKPVYTEDDYFEKVSDQYTIKWLVPTAQKNAMEPILMTVRPSGVTDKDLPHEGEEFGMVLEGEIMLNVGKRRFKASKGESFYFRSSKTHFLENLSDTNEAIVLWMSCPPNF